MREIYGFKAGSRVQFVANRGSTMLTAGDGWLLLRAVERDRCRPTHAGRPRGSS